MSFKKDIRRYANEVQEDFRHCDGSSCMAWTPDAYNEHGGYCELIVAKVKPLNFDFVMAEENR